MPRHVMASVIALIALTATSGEAQWLNYPTPGIPRLPDGKPNLNAPAPRTADGKSDLSGLWSAACGQGCPVERRELFDLANSLSPEAVQMTPWAAGIQKQRESRRSVVGFQNLWTRCSPMAGLSRLTPSRLGSATR